MNNTLKAFKDLFQSLQMHFTGTEGNTYSGKDVQNILKAYIFNGEKEPVTEEKDMTMHLGIYKEQVNKRLQEMERAQFALRFWKKDPTLWKRGKSNKDIESFMGWLNVSEEMQDRVEEIEKFTEEVINKGFKRVVLLGMGGSSLAPYVFTKTFPFNEKGLILHVLDSTHPQSIEEIEFKVPLEHTLFLVSSKSGSTAEVNALFEYFYAKIKAIKGRKAGENFVAITDPGSPLVELSVKLKFAHTFINFEDIGGRYSAISYFGLVPASLMGIDISEMLARTSLMVRRSTPDVPVIQNPGLKLGGALAELALHGKNKLNIISSSSLSSMVMWIEQLVAESTGKDGKGILPVDEGHYCKPEKYSDDCVFVNIQLKDDTDPIHEKRVKELMDYGFPVISIFMKDEFEIAAEFYRWEIATATAGAIFGINPFDQPNVQENKTVTEELIKELQAKGSLSEEEPLIKEEGLKYHTNLYSMKGYLLLEDFFSRAHQGDYITIQAYLPEDEKICKLLNEIKSLLQEWLCVATTIGYGPRFLHSTGQYHKGGPNNGLFLQITAPVSNDVALPGRSYSFGQLISAQAQGDYETLVKHNRKVLKIELNEDIVKSLEVLKRKIEDAQTEHFMNVNHTE